MNEYNNVFQQKIKNNLISFTYCLAFFFIYYYYDEIN